MIRFIAALDNKRGIADDHGIPWQGKLPSDVAYYHDKIKNAAVIMGYGLYKELSSSYPGGTNYVATSKTDEQFREGFQPIDDARTFLQHSSSDIWNLGGAGLYSSTIDLADELYLTRIEADFHCTKFFPAFEDSFTLQSRSAAHTENDLTFYFEVWQRITAKTT